MLNQFTSDEEINYDEMEDFVFCTLSVLELETPSDDKINYKPLYYKLFNGITTAMEETKTYEEIVENLIQLHFAADDAFIEQEDLSND